MTSSRAGSVLTLPKVCSSPASTSTKVSGPPSNSSPATWKRTSPWSTKYASSLPVCRWAGGMRPPGGRVRSMSENRPPVPAAVALNHMWLPRACRWRPSPVCHRSTRPPSPCVGATLGTVGGAHEVRTGGADHGVHAGTPEHVGLAPGWRQPGGLDQVLVQGDELRAVEEPRFVSDRHVQAAASARHERPPAPAQRLRQWRPLAAVQRRARLDLDGVADRGGGATAHVAAAFRPHLRVHLGMPVGHTDRGAGGGDDSRVGGLEREEPHRRATGAGPDVGAQVGLGEVRQAGGRHRSKARAPGDERRHAHPGGTVDLLAPHARREQRVDGAGLVPPVEEGDGVPALAEQRQPDLLLGDASGHGRAVPGAGPRSIVGPVSRVVGPGLTPARRGKDSDVVTTARRARRTAEIARVLLRNRESIRVGIDDSPAAADDPELREQAAQLADDLESMGPAFVKLGQVLSTRPDLLPEPYLEALARLQDEVAPFPATEARRVFAEETGSAPAAVFTSFGDEPMASASVGQVHRAVLRDGRRVVVKIQRPGIHEQVAEDLEALGQIAKFLDDHTDAGRRYGFEDLLEQFRRSLTDELDYRTEDRKSV